MMDNITNTPTLEALKRAVLQDMQAAPEARKSSAYWIEAGITGYSLEESELHDLADWLKSVGYSVDRRQISTWIKNARVRQELGSLPATYEQLVEAFAAKQQWQVELFKINRNMQGVTDPVVRMRYPRQVKANEALADIQLWAANMQFLNQDRTLALAFNKWRTDQRYQRMCELFSRIKFQRLNEGVWDQFIGIICEDASRRELTKAVMKGFVWHVKNKMLGRDVTYHMMPIVGGKTGNGKSHLINAMLRAVSTDFFSVGKFTELEDANNADKFEYTPVVFMDEMERSNQADQNAIKKFLTQDELTFRVFHTQMQSSSRILSTFIGTSNEAIQDIIPDTTSSRRFWYIRTPEDMSAHWDTLNALDWLSLWTSVNEDKPNPVTAHIKAIQSIQHNEQRRKTAIESWLDEVRAEPYSEQTPKAWYNVYLDWEKAYNPTTAGKTTFQKFGRDMAALSKAGLLEMRAGRERTYCIGDSNSASDCRMTQFRKHLSKA